MVAWVAAKVVVVDNHLGMVELVKALMEALLTLQAANIGKDSYQYSKKYNSCITFFEFGVEMLWLTSISLISLLCRYKRIGFIRMTRPGPIMLMVSGTPRTVMGILLRWDGFQNLGLKEERIPRI